MTGLFGKMSNLIPKVGASNAEFKGERANGRTIQQLREMAKERWPDLNNDMARDELKFWGMG